VERRPIAIVDDESVSVYGFDGRHLGWFVEGWIRDHHGACVYYTDHATGGPVRPARRLVPNEAPARPAHAGEHGSHHRRVTRTSACGQASLLVARSSTTRQSANCSRCSPFAEVVDDRGRVVKSSMSELVG
jgi:4-fold beta-flower domain-containing protein